MIRDITNTNLKIRRAAPADRQQLNNLFHLEPYVHRHMDWRMPLEWIEHDPYLVAEKDERIIAALACPPDPPGIAWVRVFACATSYPPRHTWPILWERVWEHFAPQQVKVAALALDPWFQRVLENSGFEHRYDVTVLSWESGLKPLPPARFDGTIRQVTFDDLPDIKDIDNLAFAPIWQNSLDGIQRSYRQAAVATLAEDESGILGYQISTPSPLGGHLARLAVNPAQQGRGIGYALVRDLLHRFEQRGALRVTVNTQSVNTASQALYNKARFHPTNEHYPVYTTEIY